MAKLTDIKKLLAKDELISTGYSYSASMLRWCHTLALEITQRGLNYRAMALVYTTLLSLVPLLAVSFSVLKAFGVHNQLKPFLLEILAPLGAKGIELGDSIIGFVENVQVGVLGSVGIVLLIYSVVSLLEIIKDSFNHIWRTDETRPWIRRVSDYLSILLIGPILIFSALGITASMTSTDLARKVIAWEPFGTAYYLIGTLIPYLFIISAFTFVYLFMPSTRVKFSSALFGAIIGGLAWKAAGWVFATFVVESASYNAIYSGFAIIILFMFWIYVSWSTLLLGGVISFYHQHPSYLLYLGKCPELSHSEQENLGFVLMYLIGKSYYEGKSPRNVFALADAVSLPWQPVLNTLQVLQKNELLVSLNSEPESFLPSRAPETLHLQEIYRALRNFGERQNKHAQNPQYCERIAELASQMEQSASSVLNELTLRDLVLGDNLKV
ncbi:MAG: YihY/virulence factor BrkB family protein [Methylococcaceae bacterium]